VIDDGAVAERRQWGLVVGGIAAGVAGAALALAGTTTPQALGGYAVLGLEDVTLGRRVAVESGDVGSNRGEVRIGAGGAVAGAVVAETVRLGRGARVGRLLCTVVAGPLRFGCETLTAPVVDTGQLPLVQVVPGAAEVIVPRRASTAPLASGAYGAVRVGRRGRLFLAGGSYELRALAVGARAQLLCLRRCRLQVRERVRLGPVTTLGVVDTLAPDALRLDVEDASPRAFTAGRRAAITGTVYAPGGDIALGARGSYVGAFVGRRVRVGARARITGASAF
jgi:hypothetical protein